MDTSEQVKQPELCSSETIPRQHQEGLEESVGMNPVILRQAFLCWLPASPCPHRPWWGSGS